MSKWLSIFLCCFAANAFASSADSGRYPWKMPFTITIHGVGGLHKYQNSNLEFKECLPEDYGTEPSTSDFGFTLDTSVSYWESLGDSNIILRYSLNTDTLQFFLSHHETGAGIPNSDIISSSITFVPGEDSIISITYQGDHILSQVASIPAMPEMDYQYTFQISSAHFDDTSIFTTDSSFSKHNISMTDFETWVYTYQYSSDVCFEHYDFTAASVDLSGIFRLTHFADQSIVTEVPPPTERLVVSSFNGSLHCSFGASEEERLLEIYSPLGIRIASCCVSPGQTQAVIPRVAPGFYFVRLGNTLTKILVAE